MATLPLSLINSAVMNTLISARQAGGAHSYYKNGWRIKDTPENARALLPGWLLENGSFTVVFEHTGSNKAKKFLLLFGKYNKHEETQISIQTENKLTCQVKEKNVVQNDKSLPVNGIEMKGFHVWRFENTPGGLEVFLDGQRCVKEGSVTEDKKEYTVLQGKPAQDSPIVLWETHHILPDITSGFDPKYLYNHEKMELGIGSYAEFHGDWNIAPKIWVKGVDYSTPAKWESRTGEQIIVVRVFANRVMMVTSANPSKYAFRDKTPVSSTVEVGKPGTKKLYNMTIVFGEIKV